MSPVDVMMRKTHGMTGSRSIVAASACLLRRAGWVCITNPNGRVRLVRLIHVSVQCILFCFDFDLKHG